MPLDPSIATTLNTMVSDIDAKEQALASASDSNTTAQAAASSAAAAAVAAQQEQTDARSNLTDSIKALSDYLNTL